MATAYDVRDGRAVYNGRTLDEWVPDVVRELIQLVQPERIILFGSVGRGDDGPDSNIDLMVVLSELDYGERRELTARLRSGLRAPLRIQLFLTDERECRRRRDVIGSIHYHPLREGRLVYDRAATVRQDLGAA